MSALRQEDDAPRGFVPMRDYLRLQRRVDELEELLALSRDDARCEMDAKLVNHVRLTLGIAPQKAKLVIAIARENGVTREILHHAVGAREDGHTHHVSVLTHFVNAQVASLGGPPKTIVGRKGPSSFYALTPEGRAWLQERLPEIFQQKGRTR